jgi:hypothetical protein
VIRVQKKAQGSTLVGTGDFSFPKCTHCLWGPPSLFNGKWDVFPRLKQPDLEADHSLPSGAKVKNQNSSISSPSVCLHGMDSGNFEDLGHLGCDAVLLGEWFLMFGRIMVPLAHYISIGRPHNPSKCQELLAQ